MQRISLGALIIALALLVDDAMTTTDAMLIAARGGRRQGAGRDLRLPHLRLRHARRHARHHRRLRAGRLRGELGRRIHVLALRRRRHRARRVLVRGGALRAAARRRDPDPARTTAGGGARLGVPHLPQLPRRGDAREVGDDPGDVRAVRRLAPGAAAGAAAVLSVLRPPRAAGRPEPAAERLDLRHRDRGAAVRRRAAQGRSGRRALEHLCRPRRDPLLSAAQRAAPQRLLRPGRDRGQGRRRARAAPGPSSRRSWPRISRASIAASIRWSSVRRSAGRCSTASAAPISAKVREIALELARRSSPRTRRRCISTSTGSSRRGRCASASTRTRRACWGSARRPWRACSTPSSPARPSRRCATTSIWSTSSRAPPTSSASRSPPCALCRCRCRTGARFRSASSRPSSYEQDYPLVWRRDRVPTLTVQADVAPGVLPETVVAALAPAIEALAKACRGPTGSPSAAPSRRARSRRPP